MIDTGRGLVGVTRAADARAGEHCASVEAVCWAGCWRVGDVGSDLWFQIGVMVEGTWVGVNGGV
jgi:hypothetical protein